MLNIVSFPHTPEILMIVMSPESISIYDQLLVSVFAHIKITDLVLKGSFAYVEGYITCQSLEAIVTAKSLIAGS
jgi:hypothetical protein